MNIQNTRNVGDKMDPKIPIFPRKDGIWNKINKKIEWSLLKIGLIYICLFLITTIIIRFQKTKLTQLQGVFYFIAFGIFFFFVWLVFVESIFRGEK